MKKLFIALAAVALTAGKAKAGIPPSKPYKRTLVNGMPTV